MALSETDIKAKVSRELALAISDNAELTKKRTKALEYYQGEMKDLVAEDGRSHVVSRDVADVIGWKLPQIMRVFCASDRMALCEPVGDEDEEFARQATDGINYTFWKENDGYRILRNATWDSMLGGNGVVKVYWDPTPKEIVSYHSGLTDDALADLVGDDAVEVLAHSEGPVEFTDPETQTTAMVNVHQVKIRKTVKGGHTCVEAIPPEDYGKDARSTTCEAALFQYHRADKTRSDLIEMGFDRTKVDALPVAVSTSTGEKTARQTEQPSGEGADKSTEIVDYYECFIQLDVDDDGISELCRVCWGGDSSGGDILSWEVWEDEQVFYDIPCYPMPHKWEAQSEFDKSEDVQRVKTVMLRNANDNTYATNNPQRFVKGKISNPEELFSPSFGGAVFGDTDAEIVPLTIPFVANHAYDALNYQDQVIQRRTGVGRQTMALDPEALTNQSATANQNEKDANYSQVELVARDMAELGWVNVFKAILRTEVKHQDQPRTIRMSGKPVKIDPRWWNTDMDVSINVGLGTGSRDRDAAMLNSVQQQQMAMIDRFVAVGEMEEAIRLLPYLHNTQVKFAEAVGLRNPESFYPEYNPEQLMARAQKRASQPNPQIQLEQMKAESAKGLKEVDAQVAMQQAELKAQGDIVKNKAELEADMQTKDADRQNAIALETVKQSHEDRRFFAKLAQERELALAQMSMVEQETGETDESGKPKKAVKSKADIGNETLMQGMQAMAQTLASLAETMNRPKSVTTPDGRTYTVN